MTSKSFLGYFSSKVFVFRGLVLTSLVIASILFGTFTYLLLAASEDRNYTDQYASIADQVDSVVEVSIRSTISAGEELSLISGLAHNQFSNWPNSSIMGFQQISEKLRTMVQVQATMLTPIVHPEDLPTFEAYSKELYTTDPAFPPGSGYSPGIGYGVYKFLNRTTRELDRSGETRFSPYKILTPVLNIFPLARQSRVLSLNLHSDPVVGRVLDGIIDCVKNEGSVERNYTSCSALTDMFLSPTTQTGIQPVSFLYFPVFPFQDPDKLVGFVGMGYTWLAILRNAVPDYVSGIDCVLCSPSVCYTYTINDGEPELRGEGDLHDREFSSSARSVRFGLGDLAASGSVEFEILIYPSKEFYDIYHTDLPLYCTIGAVLLIIVTSLIFMGYDRFVKADARATKAVLESKKQFVRYISHEIRTPLNTVNVGLNVLEGFLDKIPEEVGEFADINEIKSLASEIRAGAETAVTVVNDFLQYDKVESSTLSIEVALLDPVELLQSTAKLFELQGKGNDVSLKFHIDDFKLDEEDGRPCQLKILADRIRLAQVIRNLISNALKFSPSGGEVQVTCNWKPDGLSSYKITNPDFQSCEIAGSLLLSVQDSGAGISKENQKKLFGEGVQFNVNELQGGQGSGLGLWISKAIVVLHGGMIWAESEGEGKGTTFFVELTLLKSNGKETTDRKDSIISTSGDKILIDSLSTPKVFKVMIVDDAPSNRKMLTRLLQMKGYDCVSVEDGRDCVQILEEEASKDICSYDCILLDYQMVHLNGPETAEKVRELGFGSDRVKIIGVTGNVMREDVNIFMDKGADFIMQKPFSFEIFLNEMVKHR